MQCDRHYAIRRNGTVFGEYESIPRTLVLNLIAWPLLLLLFSILRKLAWDYGRIALVSRDQERWMSLFFGDRANTARRQRLSCSGSAESLDRTLKRQDKGFCSWIPAFFRLKDEHIRRKCGNDAVQYLQFQRYLISYAAVICLISLGVILPINFMGSEYDASHFARTTISNLKAGDPQLWIHFLLAVVYLVMALVFMRHFSKNLQFYEDEQASRTLMATGLPRNISAQHLNALIRQYFKQAYSHTSVGYVERVRLVDVQFAFDVRRLLDLDLCRTRAKLALLNMSLLAKRGSSTSGECTYENGEDAGRPRVYSEGDSNSRAQVLTHALPRFLSEAESLEYVQMRSRPSGSECVSSMQTESRMHAEIVGGASDNGSARLTLHPYMCGQVLCCNALAALPCCSCCAEVDADAFYRAEVEHYTHACGVEQRRALEKPCGVAFLTFETAQQAHAVLIDFKRTNLLAAATPRSANSSSGAELRVAHWYVGYSPEPNNVQWQNLAVSRVAWWFKAVVLNLAVFAVVFLFTTPSLIVNELRRVDLDARLALAFERDVSFFAEFVHLLIIVLFTSLLPYFVFYTNQFVGNWTRSAAHLVVMYKSFILLVLMIIVLPSIGFTSALLFVLAFFRSLFFDSTTDALNRNWRCIFEPSNGAFFVRYVMTAAFIGTSFELLRFADLFLFAVRMLAARSAAERATIRKRATDEFEFGRNYAHQLCVFSVLVAYSIPVPLVTPFGVIYIALRYAVDRHNLYFALKPSRIDKHIHTSAINFFMSSLILLQLNVVFYLTTKSSSTESTQNPSSTSAATPSAASSSSGSDPDNVVDLGWKILQVSAIGTFLITLIVFCGCSMFDWFKHVSPIVYTTRQNSRLTTTSSDLGTAAAAADAADADPVGAQPVSNGNAKGNGHACSNGNHVHYAKNDAKSTCLHSHPASTSSTDNLVGMPQPSHGDCPVASRTGDDTGANGHADAANHHNVPRRAGPRRRDAAFMPSVLLKHYEEWPSTPCHCLVPKHTVQETSSSALSQDATCSPTSGGPERDLQTVCPDVRTGTHVLVHAADDETPAERSNIESRIAICASANRCDRPRRSISLSPQSRAGYESIALGDCDTEYNENGIEINLDRALCPSASISCISTHERTNVPGERYTVSRSRTVAGDSFTFCPQITVTAPTPARLSSTSMSWRLAERTVFEQDASDSGTCSEQGERVVSTNGHGGFSILEVEEESNVHASLVEESCVQLSNDSVQHSNARHNFAFS